MELYCIWNYDCDEPIFVSPDKGLLEEMMYDLFLKDAYEEFCWSLFSPYGNYELTIDEAVKDAYDTTDDWYNNYMAIIDLSDKYIV